MQKVMLRDRYVNNTVMCTIYEQSRFTQARSYRVYINTLKMKNKWKSILNIRIS